MEPEEEKPGSTEKEEWDRIYSLTPPEELPWEQWKPPEELVKLVKQGELPPGTRAIDLGCGLGTNTIYLASQGLVAVGVDISPSAIKKARQRATQSGVKVTFVEGDVLALPFTDGSFDFALDRGCFHHLDARIRQEYVREVSRVLAPDGKLLLISFRSRITPMELQRLFSRNFEVEAITPTESVEANTGAIRKFYTAFMRKAGESFKDGI